jgi:hypothetical protein
MLHNQEMEKYETGKPSFYHGDTFNGDGIFPEN